MATKALAATNKKLTKVSTASLVLYGKVPGLGWRRGSISFAKNGVPKPHIILISGREVTTEQSVYQIRQYVNRQAKYTSVGSSYKEAEALLERLLTTRNRDALNLALGVEIPKTEEELAAEEAERKAARKTFLQYAEEYVGKKQKLSVDTRALYRDTIYPFIKATGKKYAEDVVGQDVVNYYDSLQDAGYALRTCQTRYIILRGFLKRCGINLADLIDDADHKRMRKQPDPETEPYTHEQTDRLLAACDPYHRLVFTLLLSTGMRMQEAMHLTWKQVKWEENHISIVGSQTIHHAKTKKIVSFSTKTGRGRKVPLFPSLRAMLEEWRAEHPETIYVLGTRRDLPNNHWLPPLKAFAQKAGLNCGVCKSCADKGECEEFYLHKFRHTFAHRCLSKFSIFQVSKWLGHSDLSTTSIYLSGTPDDAAGDPFAQVPKPSASTNVVSIAKSAGAA